MGTVERQPSTLSVCELLSKEWRGFPGQFDVKGTDQCKSYLFRAHGLEFCVENGKVAAIYVYNECNGFCGCALRLPEPFSLRDCAKDFVQKFGEPSRKSGGGVANIVLTYEGNLNSAAAPLSPLCRVCAQPHCMNFEVEFATKSWSDPRAAVYSLCFF